MYLTGFSLFEARLEFSPPQFNHDERMRRALFVCFLISNEIQHEQAIGIRQRADKHVEVSLRLEENRLFYKLTFLKLFAERR